MKRSIFVFSATLLALAGCNGTEQETETDDPSGATINVTMTAPTTTESSATDTTTTTGTPETESESGTTTSGESECVDNSDCDAMFVCLEGKCEFDPNDCGDADIDIPITTPNVMLVLDKSGSMVNFKWDNDNDPETPTVTRWFSLYKVVEFIVTEFNNSMNLGMVLYPSLDAIAAYEPIACDVKDSPEVPVAPQNGQSILMTLPPAGATQQIQGGTPTRLGMDAAISNLLGFQDGLPKFIILVTDGAANCRPEAMTNEELFEEYDHQLTQTVADAAAEGISTFVVGIDIINDTVGVGGAPMSEQINPYQELNDVAEAGGVPKDDPNELFYNAQNQLELQAALEVIAQQVLPCLIDLNPVPVYPDFVEVTINGVFYGDATMQVENCDTEDGWQFVDDTYTQIRLCGQACADFQGSGSIEAKYICPDAG